MKLPIFAFFIICAQCAQTQFRVDTNLFSRPKSIKAFDSDQQIASFIRSYVSENKLSTSYRTFYLALCITMIYDTSQREFRDADWQLGYNVTSGHRLMLQAQFDSNVIIYSPTKHVAIIDSFLVSIYYGGEYLIPPDSIMKIQLISYFSKYLTNSDMMSNIGKLPDDNSLHSFFHSSPVWIADLYPRSALRIRSKSAKTWIPCLRSEPVMLKRFRYKSSK